MNELICDSIIKIDTKTLEKLSNVFWPCSLLIIFHSEVVWNNFVKMSKPNQSEKKRTEKVLLKTILIKN